MNTNLNDCFYSTCPNNWKEIRANGQVIVERCEIRALRIHIA